MAAMKVELDGVVSGTADWNRNTVLLFDGHQEFEVGLARHVGGNAVEAVERIGDLTRDLVGHRVVVTVEVLDG